MTFDILPAHRASAADPRQKMKVTAVTAIPVAVPLRSPMISALGVQKTSEYAVVLVETDLGITGLGEISMIWHGNGISLCDTVNDLLGPAVVGLDPFRITEFHSTADDRLAFGRHSLAAVAAVETALLDIQGRTLGVPIYDLLGGLARQTVPLSMSLSIAPIPQMLEQAHSYRQSGFTTVKVKGSGEDRDVAAVRALRREFGEELGIRIDFNMGCATAKQALRLIRKLRDEEVLSVEQPLPAADIDGMAMLREHSDLPIMADESVWTTGDGWRVIKAQAADLINVYVPEAGGPTAARSIVDMCAAAGVGVAVGSMPELGIGTAAAAHVAFSAARLDHPSDVAGHLYHADDVVDSGLRIEGGNLYPPTGVGLGVELDPERLAAYRLDQP